MSLPQARLWSVDVPNLYELTLRLGNDEVKKRFGFRWFEVRTVKGDKQFYLNGKRITLVTAISWSFWPGNGITPSRELAYKQVRDAKQLGMTMLNFHRTMATPMYSMPLTNWDFSISRSLVETSIPQASLMTELSIPSSTSIIATRSWHA